MKNWMTYDLLTSCEPQHKFIAFLQERKLLKDIFPHTHCLLGDWEEVEGA